MLKLLLAPGDSRVVTTLQRNIFVSWVASFLLELGKTCNERSNGCHLISYKNDLQYHIFHPHPAIEMIKSDNDKL